MITKALRLVHRCAPDRLTMTPIARNRQQYERLVAKYEGIGLSSFAPDDGQARCPIG